LRNLLTAILLSASWGCAAPVGTGGADGNGSEEKVEESLAPPARVAILRLANELTLQQLVDGVSLPHHTATQIVDYRDEDLDGFTSVEEFLSLEPVNGNTVQLLNRHAEQLGLLEMENWHEGLPDGSLSATFKLTLAMADSSGECTSLRHCPIDYSTTQAGCALSGGGDDNTTITCWDDDTLAPHRLEAIGIIGGDGTDPGSFEMTGGPTGAEPYVRGYILRRGEARHVVIQKYAVLYADEDGETRLRRLSVYPVRVPLRMEP